LQRAAGLKVCTDGEMHRRHWAMDFIERIDGVVYEGALPTRFRTESAEGSTLEKGASFTAVGRRQDIGYLAIRDEALRDRVKKVLFFTTSNVASIVQYGGIGALEGTQECVDAFRTELRERRALFYDGIAGAAREVFSGSPPAGAFYAFLRINPAWHREVLAGESASLSWRMTEYLIKNGRIGCVPGIDFGSNGEGYVRFCFARERTELVGALESMKRLFEEPGRLGTASGGRRG